MHGRGKLAAQQFVVPGFVLLVAYDASLAVRVFVSTSTGACGNAAAIALFIATAAGLALTQRRGMPTAG